MSITITDKPASERSIKFLTDLATKRDWRNVLQGQLYETALDALGNVGNPDPKFISQREASKAIDALLKIKPPAQVVGVGVNTHVGFAAVDHSLLTQVLATLPLSKYALPRRSDPTIWDFFEVIERKNGTRYLNRLLGAPGNWNRSFLTAQLQLTAAQAVAVNPQAAAFEYANQHGRCSCCDAKLSNPKSIAASMGPVCRKRFGL